MNNWTQTYTKKKFDALNPTPDMIDIEDIARGLALTCRFSGQCKEFYSVAQHSYYVSKLQNKKGEASYIRKWKLLHDAPEAYIGDIPSPIKAIIPEYKAVEKRIMDAVCEKFNLPKKMPEEVHLIDKQILTLEANYLMIDLSNKQPKWEMVETDLDFFFQPMDWKMSEYLFLKEAQKLGIYKGIL
jgi:5'-deoxynucleotidase YfbR-like HD superfamily hydrolase